MLLFNLICVTCPQVVEEETRFKEAEEKVKRKNCHVSLKKIIQTYSLVEKRDEMIHSFTSVSLCEFVKAEIELVPICGRIEAKRKVNERAKCTFSAPDKTERGSKEGAKC